MTQEEAAMHQCNRCYRTKAAVYSAAEKVQILIRVLPTLCKDKNPNLVRRVVSKEQQQHALRLKNYQSTISSERSISESHACRLTLFFSFSTVTVPPSKCHFSLQIRSTKSVFGSIIKIPPRKVFNAFANASTVSTSK